MVRGRHVDKEVGYDDAHVTEISVEFHPEPAMNQKQRRRSDIKPKLIKFWKKRQRRLSSLRFSMKTKLPRIDEELELMLTDASEECLTRDA